MRSIVLWLLLAAVAAAEYEDETMEDITPEEEEIDPDDPYAHLPEEEEEDYYRRKRDIHDEHIRIKRCCEDRVRRSTDYVRTPRQVHQYEVHESTDEHDPSSPPYEEMLAASANHYHRTYAAPDSLKTARYLNPDVSADVLSVPSNHQFVQAQSHPLNNQPGANQPINHAPVPLQKIHQYVNHAPLLTQQNHQPIDHAPVLTLQQNLRQLPSKLQAPFHMSSPVLSPTSEVPPAAAAGQAGDLAVAAAGVQHKHSHGHSQGGGHHTHGGHHKELGKKTSKGFNHDHFVDKGGKGHKTDDYHRKEYEEAQGKKKKHHDIAGHKGSHEEQAHGHRGAKFDEKKGHKKGHKTKGYHNKYHKDEFHKEHKFYDDYHKSGEHHRYGKFNAKHAANESGKKKAHHVNAGHDYVERGKKGFSNKGHVDADHKGHDGKSGHEEHNQHHSSHGKKGGQEKGAHWGYSKKN